MSDTAGPCPFVAGPMIEDPRLFFGRREELRLLAARMSGVQPVSVNVTGERRIGKSSLLYHFFQSWEQRVDNPARFVVVYLDLLKEGPQTTADFYQALAGALRRRPAVQQIEELQTALISLPGSHKAFSALLDAFAAQGLLPVFCLDEFEKLLKRQDRFTDSFYDRLRGFMNANRLMLIPASRKSLDVCAGEQRLTSAFFNLGHLLPLAELSTEAADELVNLSLPGPVLRTGDQRMARKWGGRHPYLLQLAATELFEARQFGKNTAWAKKRFRAEQCRIETVSVWKRPLGAMLRNSGCSLESLSKDAVHCKTIIVSLVVGIAAVALLAKLLNGTLNISDLLGLIKNLKG